MFRMVIGGAIGLLAGAALGQLLKSRGGTCPLTCNPIGGAIFGAVLGALVASAIRPGSAVPPSAAVPAVTSVAEFDQAVLGAPGPVLVDFYGPNCIYCVKLAPIIEKLAEEYAGKAKFVSVNVQSVGALAERYGITGVPVVILFAGGREVRRFVGLKPEQEYRAALDAAVAGAGPDAAAPPAPAPIHESAEAAEPPKGIDVDRAYFMKGLAMKERAGEVTFKGDPLTLLGDSPAVGATVPQFALLANNLAKVAVPVKGKVCVLLTVPSLDTKVCDLEVRRFNEEAAKLPGVEVLAISMDLPFAQARWCGGADIKNVRTLSDHYDGAAGLALGVLIKELRLEARAVFVVDAEGKVAYRQIVPEMTHEPDYAAALEAVRKLAGK